MVEITLSFGQIVALLFPVAIVAIAILCLCPNAALAKGGSSVERYPKRDPEPPELTSMRKTLYNALYPTIADVTQNREGKQLAADTTQSALRTINKLTDALPGLFDRIPGLMEQQDTLLGTYLDETGRYLDFLKSGELPQAIADNMYKSLNDNINASIGARLNELAYGGVVGSSSFDSAMNEVSQEAADAMARNYLSAYNAVGDQYSRGIQGYKGGLDVLGQQIGDSISHTGQMANTIKVLGDVPTAAYNAYYAPAMPAYNFWSTLQRSYDQREDYDTVVKQGK